MKQKLKKLTAVVSAAAVAIAGVNFGGIGGLTARAETHLRSQERGTTPIPEVFSPLRTVQRSQSKTPTRIHRPLTVS